MKKIKFLLFLSALTLLSISCEDLGSEPEQNTEQPGSFVANIDGETIDFLYKPKAILATCNDIPCMWFEGRIGAEGNKEIFISINNLTGTGTYLIGGASVNFGMYETWPPEGGQVTSYGSSTEEGFLTVTSYEGNKIKGNFSFPAVKINDISIVISISGTFDLIVSE